MKIPWLTPNNNPATTMSKNENQILTTMVAENGREVGDLLPCRTKTYITKGERLVVRE